LLFALLFVAFAVIDSEALDLLRFGQSLHTT
jgi:hypothetical protein